MNNNLLSYLEYTKQPWGRLFYQIVWRQLPKMTNKKIMDFGSGFGITAQYLSAENTVVAIEPSKDMIPNLIGCVGAALIIIAGIATLFSKSQHARQICFYLMSGGAMLKIVTMEIARILL